MFNLHVRINIGIRNNLLIAFVSITDLEFEIQKIKFSTSGDGVFPFLVIEHQNVLLFRLVPFRMCYVFFIPYRFI